jgi:hypothetical protein
VLHDYSTNITKQKKMSLRALFRQSARARPWGSREPADSDSFHRIYKPKGLFGTEELKIQEW